MGFYLPTDSKHLEALKYRPKPAVYDDIKKVDQNKELTLAPPKYLKEGVVTRYYQTSGVTESSVSYCVFQNGLVS